MAVLEYTPLKTYYHYTSFSGFTGIVKSGQLWLSELNSGNDPRETDFGWLNILSALQRARHEIYVGESGLWVSILAGQIAGVLKRQKIFSASFTSLGDSLPLWREYTAEGDGIAIGFRPRSLTDMTCRIQKVRYIRAEREEEIFNLVAEILKKVEFLEDQTPQMLFDDRNIDVHTEIVVGLMSAVHSIKSIGWAYEDEMRLTFASTMNHPRDLPITLDHRERPISWSPPKERKSRWGPVLYYELPFGKIENNIHNPKSAFAELIVGPNANCSIEEIERELTQSGYSVPRITRSEHVFR